MSYTLNGHNIAPYGNLRGVYLRDADLGGANLCGANFSYADLSYTNLSDADLCGADLSYADLSYADLRDADFRDANLSGADLGYADLSDANLCGAVVCGANLSGADLRGAVGILKLGPSLTGRIWYIVTTNTGPMIYAGCRTFTLKQARDHWNKTRTTGKIGEERQMFLDFIEKWYNLQREVEK